jgi:hypothetical protein
LGIGHSASLCVRSSPLAGKVCVWPSQGHFLLRVRCVEESFDRGFARYSTRRDFTKSFQKRLFFRLETKREIIYNFSVMRARRASLKNAKEFGSVAQENNTVFVHVSKTFLKFLKRH